ncbi:MAG: hypothetical protein EZS28_041746, partial [Streblomastix strix]
MGRIKQISPKTRNIQLMNQDPPAAQQLPVNIAQQQPVEPELPPQQQINDENAILPFMQ